jgi:putative tryptophan/tyrosine transport system substrate-binding protein
MSLSILTRCGSRLPDLLSRTTLPVSAGGVIGYGRRPSGWSMRRRDFITLLSGAAAAWPLPARPQQPDRMRRVGVLMQVAESDRAAEAGLKAFVQGLEELGWIDGRNVRLDIRWGAGDRERYRRYARELLALSPDVILARTSSVVAILEETTRTVPIVFVGVIDPVGAGLVDSLARPGGNATGFTFFEYAIGAKWLELLKEIAPSVTRVAVLRDPTVAAGIGQFAAIQTVGPIGIELSVIDLRDADAIERAIAVFARRLNGGLIVTASAFGSNHPDVIAALAARYKLPAVYPSRYYVSAGGLISYGPDAVSQFRPAAGYVDRILKGEKPADLPVQAPTKYELIINLKTARALGLDLPPSVVTRADEVIE